MLGKILIFLYVLEFGEVLADEALKFMGCFDEAYKKEFIANQSAATVSSVNECADYCSAKNNFKYFGLTKSSNGLYNCSCNDTYVFHQYHDTCVQSCSYLSDRKRVCYFYPNSSEIAIYECQVKNSKILMINHFMNDQNYRIQIAGLVVILLMFTIVVIYWYKYKSLQIQRETTVTNTNTNQVEANPHLNTELSLPSNYS